jgi:hypothetical protein
MECFHSLTNVGTFMHVVWCHKYCYCLIFRKLWLELAVPTGSSRFYTGPLNSTVFSDVASHILVSEEPSGFCQMSEHICLPVCMVSSPRRPSTHGHCCEALKFQLCNTQIMQYLWPTHPLYRIFLSVYSLNWPENSLLSWNPQARFYNTKGRALNWIIWSENYVNVRFHVYTAV